MVEIRIKWYWLLLLVATALIVAFGVFYLKERNKWQNKIEISLLKLRLDSLSKQTTSKAIEYRDRIQNNTKIVEKWERISDTILKRDTLLIEAKNDILYLDTSLNKCETALSSCLLENEKRKELNVKLEQQKKPSIIVTYIGVGGSLDKNLDLYPSVNGGIGINLNSLFRK